MSVITKEQVSAAIRTTQAVAEAIRELKEVPSGQLYARLMSVLSLSQYNQIIDVLKKAGVVSESNHLLKWIGN